MTEGRIAETWRVVDRWWTEVPVEREYRVVERDGRDVTEWRRTSPDVTPWQIISPNTLTHNPPRNRGEGAAVNGPTPVVGGDDA